MSFKHRFAPWYNAITGSVYKFCEAMRFRPTHQQRQVLDIIQDITLRNARGRVAVKSGQGPGKTTVSVIIALWRLMRFPESLVVVTAPTMRQCREVWLAEARRLVGGADDFLKRFISITQSRIIIAQNKRWGVQLVTATNAEAMQGFHRNPGLDFIADEAAGIPRELITQIKGTLSNPDSLFLMIGNPNSRDCSFFDCFNSERQKWRTLTLNAEESPPWLVDRRRNEEIAEEFGKDSDHYRIRVLGEFPYEDPNCVMSSDDLEKCTLTDPYSLLIVPRASGKAPAKQFGIDLARYGADESVVFQRQGHVVLPDTWWPFAHRDPAEVVEFAFRQQIDSFWKDAETYYVFDAGGLGQGVIHKFSRARKQYLEFHTQGVSTNSEFANRATEAWFSFARLVKRKQVHIPPDNRLIQQLSTRKYFTRKKDGKLILEDKDEYMREHDSPDRADAITMAFYDSVVVSAPSVTKGRAAKRVGLRTR